MTMGPASVQFGPDALHNARFHQIDAHCIGLHGQHLAIFPFFQPEQVGVFRRIFFQLLPDGLVDHLGGQVNVPGIPPTLGSGGATWHRPARAQAPLPHKGPAATKGLHSPGAVHKRKSAGGASVWPAYPSPSFHPCSHRLKSLAHGNRLCLRCAAKKRRWDAKQMVLRHCMRRKG